VGAELNLVTGASGFIGGRLVRRLVELGESVRVLVRPDADLSGLDGLNFDLVEGDILTAESLDKAAAGCRRIYHAAALYRLWLRNPSLIYRTNVEGTRNVIEAGLKAGVERIVYTSSAATVGLVKGGSGNEDTPVTLHDMVGHYKRSKFLAEEVANAYAAQGAPLVIVNPTYPVGEGDVKPTPTGQMIVDFIKGKMPAYLDTGLNVVDVDDVAEGHILAAEKGQNGRRYILGNANMTLKEILYLLADITGLPKPYCRLPFYPILGLAYLDSGISMLIPGREPRVPPDGVKMARQPMFFDASRAFKELGLPQTSPRVALEKAVNWFINHGYA
jgi:dihydroflavonol-4-reductase